MNGSSEKRWTVRPSDLISKSGSWLLAIMVVCSMFALPPSPVHACSCMATPLSEYADDVALAFAGRKVGGSRYKGNEITQVFDVQLVFKGRVGRRISLPTYVPCELRIVGDGLTGIAAFRDSDGNLWLNLCGSRVGLDELVEVFGEGYPADGDAEALRLQADAARQEAEEKERELAAMMIKAKDWGREVGVLRLQADAARQEVEEKEGELAALMLTVEGKEREAEVLRLLLVGGVLLVLGGVILLLLGGTAPSWVD